METLLPPGHPAKEILSLVLPLGGPSAFPPSEEYKVYSGRVKSIISNVSEQKARQMILDIDAISYAVNGARLIAYYPALKQYVTRFRRTPELLVVLFSEASTVSEMEGAGEYLRDAHALDPINKYVLWQLLVSRGVPWFPNDLVRNSDPFADEMWILEQLLRQDPYDPLALGIRTHLRESRKSLFQNRPEFFNRLSPLIPTPLRAGLRALLDPRVMSSMDSGRMQ